MYPKIVAKLTEFYTITQVAAWLSLKILIVPVVPSILINLMHSFIAPFSD